MPDTASVIDLGAIGRPQQVAIQPTVLIAEIPVAGQPINIVTAKMLVDAILAGVRLVIQDIRPIIREELHALLNEPDITNV